MATTATTETIFDLLHDTERTAEEQQSDICCQVAGDTVHVTVLSQLDLGAAEARIVECDPEPYFQVGPARPLERGELATFVDGGEDEKLSAHVTFRESLEEAFERLGYRLERVGPTNYYFVDDNGKIDEETAKLLR